MVKAFHLVLFFVFVKTAIFVGNCPPNTKKSIDGTICYSFNKIASDFRGAENNCVFQGGHLAFVDSAITNSFLSHQANNITWQDYWIGVQKSTFNADDSIVKLWTWTDPTKFITYFDWATNQPDSSKDFVAVSASDGTWFTADDSARKPYVCSFPASINYCEDDWSYFSYTNFCYKLFTYANWTNAENYCLSMNAHLASIHSENESEFIVSLSSCGSNYTATDWGDNTWVGLYDSTHQGKVWNWTDGTAVDYLNWMRGEPDNPGVQNCVSFYTNNNYSGAEGKIFTSPCPMMSRNYICKRPAKNVRIRN